MKVTNQSAALNTLLATSQTISNNVQARHWLVSGKHFTQLHTLFGEVYNAMKDASDKIAETIRVIDAYPLTTFAEINDASEVVNSSPSADSAEMMAIDTKQELNTFIDSVQKGVAMSIFDPTTENDLLTITSGLRHYLLFLDGFIEDWVNDLKK